MPKHLSDITVTLLLSEITAALTAQVGEDAAFTARMIICEVTKTPASWLYAHGDSVLCESDAEKIREFARRRASGEPLQYILGHWGFMGYDFIVNDGALIPRQDTETLVEHAYSLIASRGYTTLLDMCCGSGCIGLSIKKLAMEKQLPLHVTLADISEKCVQLAKMNADALQIAPQDISVIQSDMFSNVQGTYDIITINPPYLTLAEMNNVQKEMRYEPENALFGGVDGLDFYRKTANQYKGFLKGDLRQDAGGLRQNSGLLVMEIGANQGNDVRALFESLGKVCVIKDLCGHARVVVVG